MNSQVNGFTIVTRERQKNKNKKFQTLIINLINIKIIKAFKKYFLYYKKISKIKI